MQLNGIFQITMLIECSNSVLPLQMFLEAIVPLSTVVAMFTPESLLTHADPSQMIVQRTFCLILFTTSITHMFYAILCRLIEFWLRHIMQQILGVVQSYNDNFENICGLIRAISFISFWDFFNNYKWFGH